jgi:hypothetical protein
MLGQGKRNSLTGYGNQPEMDSALEWKPIKSIKKGLNKEVTVRPKNGLSKCILNVLELVNRE